MSRELFIAGPMTMGEGAPAGIDDLEVLAQLGDYPGGIWTNRVEVLGPALKQVRVTSPSPQ